MCWVVMDTTAANKKAMRMLEATFPWMLCLGCQAHCLSLLIKDFVKRLEWLSVLYDMCIKISNLANGCKAMKASLHACMAQVFNVVRVICSHVDTRFGSRHFVLRDCVKNYGALSSWAVSDAFREQLNKTSQKPANIDEVYDYLLSRDQRLLTEGAAANALIDPIMNVMHEIEGNKPYLSQMLPILRKLSSDMEGVPLVLHRHQEKW